MKNFYTNTVILSIAFFITIFSSNFSAQNTINDIPVLDSLEIAKSVNYFTIYNGLLKGNGANILKEHIASSKFFVLGENHYSDEISKLTKSLVPILNESGYKAVAFEVGPLSAEKLKELSQIPDSTQTRLKAFNGKYFNST